MRLGIVGALQIFRSRGLVITGDCSGPIVDTADALALRWFRLPVDRLDAALVLLRRVSGWVYAERPQTGDDGASSVRFFHGGDEGIRFVNGRV